MSMLKIKAMAAVSEYKMLLKGEYVIVCISGGADSVALLDFLVNSGFDLNITAAHVNHMLRGDMSDRDENFVKELCGKYNIPVKVLRVNADQIARENKIGIEECGRNIRYEFFYSLAKTSGAKIATAHTLSDKAETLIFNIIRGCSTRGLYSIPPVRENIIRPLITCSREDIEDYCFRNNLKFMNDHTNEVFDYTRNKIRHLLIPQICEINPSFLRSVEHLANSVKMDGDYLNALSEEAYNRSVFENKLILQELLCLDEPILRRVICIFLDKNGLPVEYDKIIKISEIIRNKNGKINIKKGIYIKTEKEYLICDIPGLTQENNPYFETLLFEKDRILNYLSSLDNNTVNIALINGYLIKVLYNNKQDYRKNDNKDKNFLLLELDYDKIVGTVIVRQKINGDRINILGRNVTKTLKKLFNEMKLTLSEKLSIPVFADKNGVIAVAGFGIDKRVAADENTGRRITIQITTQTEDIDGNETS